MTTWVPKRSFEECYRILCGPGELHEIETKLVDDQVQRVYKNMWPSLRDFWLWATSEYKDATYIVFEKHRRTYNEAFQRSIVIAAMLRARYNIQKGDRIIVCSRNFPDYLPTFWASQLIGAVCVFMNAWLPIEPSKHCISNTQAKLVIADPERADMFEPFTKEIAKSAGTVGFLVWEQQEGKGKWAGFDLWTQVLEGQPAVDTQTFLRELPALGPEDNAAICFTSGTTGLPKGVLSTHRQFLTNVLNVMVSTRLASLRKGESYSRDLGIPGPQKAILISVPLFHVTGMTSMSMLGTLRGLKLVFMRRWVADEGANLIKRENVAVAGGVPSMVSDLADSSAAGHPLDGLLFGGASAPDWLAKRAREAFPAAMSSQAYGLTETNSVAVGFAGEDYDYRPTSAGRASPVNDILIVKGDKVVLPGELGEVWLRGPNVMKCYWNDPAATAKAVTRDGWMRSGDIGYLDHEGFLYIRDRIKDLIIRGGENVDSVSVENAVSADERLLEVAAVGVPDARLGELVTVVACVKPAFKGKVLEEEVIESARKRLAKFAVPVMIVLQDERLPRTPSAKILKTDLRHLAKAEWERRRGNATSQVRPKL